MKLTKKQKAENEERAERGAHILGAYKLKNGLVDEDDHTVLTDMLADLMHLAHDQVDAEDGPLNFEDALRVARDHFEAEQAGEA